MKLVIAEKPSVAQSYAKALNITAKKSGYFEGNGYIITWCIGHLAGLADAAAYDEKYAVWKYEDLPILPEKWQFAINKGKENQYKVVSGLMNRNDITEIINGCDAGREGELIFRFVYNMCGCKSRTSVYGFPQWKKAQSARDLITSKTDASMIIFIIPRYAAQKLIGLSV